MRPTLTTGPTGAAVAATVAEAPEPEEETVTRAPEGLPSEGGAPRAKEDVMPWHSTG